MCKKLEIKLIELNNKGYTAISINQVLSWIRYYSKSYEKKEKI